jgi:hypothetical protein
MSANGQTISTDASPLALILPVVAAPYDLDDFDHMLFLESPKRIEAPGNRPFQFAEAIARTLRLVLWNTLELARATTELQCEGVEMTAEQLRHLSPMNWEHSSLTGDYTWDFTAKSARG